MSGISRQWIEDAHVRREASCNTGTAARPRWPGARQLERALVPRSADFCAAGNRGGVYGRPVAWSTCRQTRYPGRKELLGSGSFHHADGDDHHRRICSCVDPYRVSLHSRLGWNSQDPARSGRYGGVVLHADLADLLGLEPDLQRTLCSRVGASRQRDGLPRCRGCGVSRTGGGLGDGTLFFCCHAHGHENGDAALALQH